MLTPSSIADYVLDLYQYPDVPRQKWIHAELPTEGDRIAWGLAKIDDTYLIVLRGTTTIGDYIRDLAAVASPFTHPGLGPIHFGFWAGMEAIWNILKPNIKGKVVVTGHSLGGARAAILAGLMVLDNISPTQLVTFGAPRAGFHKLTTVISKVDKLLYVNNYDIVPNLPLRLAVEDYVDFGSRTGIDVPASKYPPSLRWGPFAPHHMRLYAMGVK